MPRGKSALSLVQKVRQQFFTGRREAEFMCVCDISKESKDVIQELNYAQACFIYIYVPVVLLILLSCIPLVSLGYLL